MFNSFKKITIYGLTSLTALSASLVSAETVPGTDYNVHFESANIVGTGRSINMHRVPVMLESTGDTVYFDVSFKLSLDGSKQLIFDGFSQITSPSLNSVENFVPGSYKDQTGNTYSVSGGGVTGDRTVWSIASTTDGVLFSANWITGAPTGHPLIGNHSLVAELVPGPSFGILGEENFSGGNYDDGALIAATQAGNSLIISSYHNFSDKSTVQNTFVLTLVK